MELGTKIPVTFRENKCLGDDTRWTVTFYFLTWRQIHIFNFVTIEKYGYFFMCF